MAIATDRHIIPNTDNGEKLSGDERILFIDIKSQALFSYISTFDIELFNAKALQPERVYFVNNGYWLLSISYDYIIIYSISLNKPLYKQERIKSSLEFNCFVNETEGNILLTINCENMINQYTFEKPYSIIEKFGKEMFSKTDLGIAKFVH